MRQVYKHQRENIMNRGHQLNVRLKVANNTVAIVITAIKYASVSRRDETDRVIRLKLSSF